MNEKNHSFSLSIPCGARQYLTMESLNALRSVKILLKLSQFLLSLV